MKGMLRSCGLENIVKLTLSICEEGLIKTAEATKQIGAPISTWSLLVDLEGLSMRHLWRPGVQSLLRIIEIVEAHYPETMGQVLIVRAPRVFPVLWTLISPFIDENTRNKFMINSGEVVKDEISKYVDEQYIPDFLGGTCLADCPAGGHIPKSSYRPVEELPDNADVLSSMYTKASVTRGYPVEVILVS
ncbi:CRAL/TRIO domain protein [Cooperia oncophora]